MLKKIFTINFAICFTQFTVSQKHYSLNTKNNSLIAGSILSIGVGTYFLYKNNYSLTADEIQLLNKETVFKLDRMALDKYNPEAAKVSDVAMFLSVASPVLLMGFTDPRHDFLTLGVMGAQNLLATTALTMLTKTTTKRIRPFAYNPNAPLDIKLNKDSRHSFFSGHTSVSFASASFLSTTYSHYFPESNSRYWVTGASFGLASLVGVLRIEAGKHFPTDIIAGAIVGTAIGWGIAKIHEAKPNKNYKASDIKIF